MANNETAPTDTDPRSHVSGLGDEGSQREVLELSEFRQARAGERPVLRSLLGDIAAGSYESMGRDAS